MAQVTTRRQLTFSDLDAIVMDVQRFPGGNLTSTGQWTPAENVDHVAKVIRFSIEGFPGKAPWWLAAIGRVLPKSMVRRPIKPGIKLGPSMSWLLPEQGIAWDAAADRLVGVVALAKRQKMTQASPVFGKLTDEQWISLHCRHAELHLGFIQVASEQS